MNDKPLPSERVIVQAPMSFTGSARRIWRIRHGGAVIRSVLTALAVTLIVIAWVLVLCWYLLFGLLLVPYRLIRRRDRERRRQGLQHRELLERIPPEQ